MSELKIFNSFGIKPTANGAAAGLDFYVPVFHDSSEETINKVFDAWQKTYKMSREELDKIYNDIVLYATALDLPIENNELNIMELFMCLNRFASEYIWRCTVAEEADFYDTAVREDAISLAEEIMNSFFDEYLTFDGEDLPGLVLSCNDYIFINTGIKLNLDPDTAAIFFDKSGRGTKGFDVRGGVVDEDYRGFVHISQAYTHDNYTDGIFYVGDKMIQLIILPIIHKEPVEVTEEEYASLNTTSVRGEKGFGSSDIKH